MPENLTAEQLTLKNTVDDFVDNTLHSLEAQLDNDAGKVRREVIQASKGIGLFGMTQPAACGGSEAGVVELTLIRETLAAANLRTAQWVLGPGPGVLAGAEGALKAQYLDAVMSGEKRGAFGFTEPDNAERPTWAQRDDTALVIHGRKSYVTGGDTADFVVVLVNVQAGGDQPKGTAMVVIDRETAGVVIEEKFESLDGSTHVSIRFEGVRIPTSKVIGQIGEGMPRALRQIGDVRIMVSAQATGMMIWTLGHLEETLQAPHRSGSPLSSREGVRLRFADLRIQAYAARSMLYRTCRLAAAGENVVNEAMATKVFTTEAASRIVDEALQMSGGKALVVGHPLERLYRRVRALRLAEGASDLLRLNLAKGRFELAKGRI